MNLKEVLSYDKDPELIMGDVIRVLVLCKGKLWLSEVIMEVAGFRRTLGEDPPKADDIKEAVRRLAKDNLVKVSRRLRADLSKSRGIADYIVELNVPPYMIWNISDNRLNRYIVIRNEVFRRALKRD